MGIQATWNIGYREYRILVTEGYVQGGTEIQVVYPTGLYLSKILLQFEQPVINICIKIYNVDKNYKDLV